MISACGGGGGGSTPTDPSAVFSLFPSGYFSNGYSEGYTLTGTDTAGGKYTGSYSIQTQEQSTFRGQPAIPLAALLQLNNTASGAFLSVKSTRFYSTNTSIPEYLGFTNTTFGTTTVSATTNPFPSTAKIGSFGSIGTYTNSAGYTDVATWKLEDGGNGKAKLVILETTSDQVGKLTSTSEEIYTINVNGKRLSVTFRLFDVASGTTINLSGNKN